MIGETFMLPLASITLGSFGMRDEEEDDDVGSLCTSIKRVGLLSPLLVRKTDDGYELMVGFRRYAACLEARLAEVPCRPHLGNATDAKECVFAENFHRKNVSPIEQAAGIRDALNEEIMTRDEIAISFGRSSDWVIRQTAMLHWPAEILEALHLKRLTVGAGSWLAQIEDGEYRGFLMNLAVDGGVTVRTAEAWYKGWVDNRPADVVGQEVASPAEALAGSPVPECPCLCCGALNRPDAMANVLMCPGCITSMRGSHLAAE